MIDALTLYGLFTGLAIGMGINCVFILVRLDSIEGKINKILGKIEK